MNIQSLWGGVILENRKVEQILNCSPLPASRFHSSLIFFTQGFACSRVAISRIEVHGYFCIQSRKAEKWREPLWHSWTTEQTAPEDCPTFGLASLLLDQIDLRLSVIYTKTKPKPIREHLSNCLFYLTLSLAQIIESWTALGFLSLTVLKFYSAVYISSNVGFFLCSGHRQMLWKLCVLGCGKKLWCLV